MTRLEALTALKEAVEAGEWSGQWRDFTRALGICPDDRHFHGINAYNGSLDAARALHEAVLPGWHWWCDPEGAHVISMKNKGDPFVEPHSAYGACPARAWLLAILAALIAQEAAE